MAVPIHTPRVNNNDDVVRLTKLWVEVGSGIRRGLPIADIETDKSVFTIEAEQEGYLLGFMAKEGDTIAVGSVLAWIGPNPGEPLPSISSPVKTPQQNTSEVNLKAALLLAQYGLSAADVPREGDRVTAGDVEKFIQSRNLEKASTTTSSNRKVHHSPPSPGKRIQLTPEQRGMVKTVEWHRQEAISAYLEISYDSSAWETYAQDFQKSNRLLVSPLVSLMAWRLVQLAKEHPEINATLSGGEKYIYDHVNLGFTVQAGERLYVVVLQEAERLSQLEFVRKLGGLQQSAMKTSLRPEETSGATIAISSMARWPVTRHVPILVPYTALMVAHTASVPEGTTLGVTYDHRVLSGADAVRVLQALSRLEGMS